MPRPSSHAATETLGLATRLTRTAREAPDRLAFAFLPDGESEAGRLTFGELEARVRALSARLEGEGLPGERAILLYPSGLDFVVAFLACLRAGVVAAPVPDVAAGREERLLPRLAAVARDARPRAVLTIAGRVAAAEALARSLGKGPAPRVLATDDVPPAEGPPDEPSVPEAGATAFLQYTSGSTSTPRGVVITHGNLDYTCRDIDAGWRYEEGSLTVSWLPIFHDMGLVVGICVPLHSGTSCVLMPPEAFVKKPLRWLKAISDRGATHSAAPNFAYDLCARKVGPADRVHLDLSAWRVALNSAEPVRKQTLDVFAEAFEECGWRRETSCPGFGLAESTVKVTASSTGDRPVVRALDAAALEGGVVADAPEGARTTFAVGCGPPILDTRIAIVDPDSCEPVQSERVGEIWVCSPSVAAGYLDRSEDTEATFGGVLAGDGEGRRWMRTGDLGFQDPDGELYCVGRIKDLVVLHGRNVYPQDVEREAEAAAPGLRPGCAAAFSAELLGEERLCVLAELDPSRGEASSAADAIARRLGEELELPVFCVLVLPPRSVPKTSSGKVQRARARELLLSLAPRALAARVQRPAAAAGWGGEALEDLLAAAPWYDSSNPDLDADPRKRGLDLAGGLALLDALAARGGERLDPAILFEEGLTAGALLHAGRGAPGPAATAGPAPQGAEDLRRAILEELARVTGGSVEAIDPAAPFVQHGLDSVLAVELAGALEERLGCAVPATLVWDHPTPDAAARALAEAESAVAPVAPAEPRAAAPSGAIAIVGVGCRFPGARGLEEYWRLLLEGRDAVVEIPRERWDAEAWYAPEPGTEGRTSTRWAGLVEDVDRFDEGLFGISAREAARMDPQQRLLLETTWEAIESAGAAPDSLRGAPVGVFVGVGSADYQRLVLSRAEDIDAFAATGNAYSVAANRISYCLDLQGPSLAVDTACSSSLVSVHLARRSLLEGECELALAGGVNLILSPEWTVAFSQAHMMAPDGRCKTFDAAANGYVRGEGCGMVMLERLEDAERNGREVLAVIRGSAVGHGGHTNGLTAPSGPQQARTIKRALESARVTPDEVAFVEAHGTGTELGDPIELRALASALGAGRSAERPLLVGSVKTNIGHLEAAAGVAGLVKAALCVSRGEIPPHLHLSEPNPHVDLSTLHLAVPTARTAWPEGAPRRAGVSSFGFGGTNAHVIVEAPSTTAPAHESPPDREHHQLWLAARTADVLAEAARRTADWVGEHEDAPLGDLCASVNASRAALPERAAIEASSHSELATRLRDLADGAEALGTQRASTRGVAPRVLAVFPGQGSQYADMARALYTTQPVFKRALDACAAQLAAHMDRPLHEVLADGEALGRTRYAQPAILAVSWSLLELWRAAGLEPVAYLGHSVGEVAAACAAGAMPVTEGLRFLAERGVMLDALPEGGGMASVMGSEKTFDGALGGVLAGFGDRLVIAAHNAPGIATIAGDLDALSEAEPRLAEAGLRTTVLEVSHAFHSARMEPALAGLEALAATVPQREPEHTLVSSRTGAVVTGVLDAAHWSVQLREPVRFQEALEAALAEGVDAVVEIGPHPVCLGLAGRLLRRRAEAPVLLPSLRKGDPDWRVLLGSVGALWARGAPLSFPALDAGRPRRLVRPPAYPFERASHWIQHTGEATRTSTALHPTPDMAPNDPSHGDAPEPLAQELARLFRQQNALLARLAGADVSRAAADLAGEAEVPTASTPELEVRDVPGRVRAVVARIAGTREERLRPEHVLHRDLGFDSLMAVELDRRLRAAFPSLPDSEELFTQDTSIEELVALVAASQEDDDDVEPLTEFQRRPREYATYAELIRKDPSETYVGGTFKAETHEIHDVRIEGNVIAAQMDVINKYSGSSSFHLTQMAAYSFLVQLVQGFLCHKHGVGKDGLGMPKLQGIHMVWNSMVRTSKDVPARVEERGWTEEDGVYTLDFGFDIAEGGVTGNIVGFLPIKVPPRSEEERSEPAEWKRLADLFGKDPKETYTGGTFQHEQQDIHHVRCDGRELSALLDVQNEWSGTKHFHLSQMGTYSFIVQLMLGYFCYKHGVEKDALGMPTLKEFQIDWTEMVTAERDIPARIVEAQTEREGGRYRIRFDFEVGDPDDGQGGRGSLVGLIPVPGE